MSVLSGIALKRRLEEEDLDKRLVVSPLLETSQLREDQASIVVRLGFQFAALKTSSLGIIDELRNEKGLSQAKLLSSYFEPRYVPFGTGIAIHPHQFVLASTLEYLRLPFDLIGYVVGRSTWGRLGLIVATAVGIQPKFAGTLTLELRNLGEAPLVMRPGQNIAQLFFHQVMIPPDASGKENSGQYIGSVDLLPRRLSGEDDTKKLMKLRDKRPIGDFS